MKDRKEFLTDEEIYILDNYPSMTYAELGIKLNQSPSMVRYKKITAERKVRKEKMQEQRLLKQSEPVTITIKRGYLWVVYRALTEYRSHLMRSKGNQPMDPDFDLAGEIQTQLWTIIKDE